MHLLEQENNLSNINIPDLVVVRVEEEGPYIVAHVKIEASMQDRFESKKYSNIKANYQDHFVEYWSFIRKKEIPEKDMYYTHNCPNCGAGLPEESGELSICSYCKTLTNTGDFDWVLAGNYTRQMILRQHCKTLQTYLMLHEKAKAIVPDFSARRTKIRPAMVSCRSIHHWSLKNAASSTQVRFG